MCRPHWVPLALPYSESYYKTLYNWISSNNPPAKPGFFHMQAFLYHELAPLFSQVRSSRR